MVIILIVLVIDAAAAFVLALLMLRYLSRWSNVRIGLIAALPIPTLLALLALYFAGSALWERRDDVPMELALTIGLGAGVLYLIGGAVALVVAAVIRGPQVDDDVRDVFS